MRRRRGPIGDEGAGDGHFGGGLSAFGYGGNGSLYVQDFLNENGHRVRKFEAMTTPAAATPAA